MGKQGQIRWAIWGLPPGFSQGALQRRWGVSNSVIHRLVERGKLKRRIIENKGKKYYHFSARSVKHFEKESEIPIVRPEVTEWW